MEPRNIDDQQSILAMATSIVSAYVGNNAVPASQLPDLIQSVVRSLSDSGAPAEAGEGAAEPVASEPAPAPAPMPRSRAVSAADDAPARAVRPTPPVPIEDSIENDYLICLEDGKRLKMLKRHLRTAYDMSPEEYRMKWGLPVDYPMVAPSYAKQRSEFAKKIGLGRKRTGRRSGGRRS